ncbi:MAG: chemotaxis protein CheW [Planctomycetota bacterium]
MGEDLEQIVGEFVLEAREGLERLDIDLVALENDAADAQRLTVVLRVLHTLKGSAGVLGFSRLEGLAHAGEAVLCRVRDGELALHTEVTSALLGLVDSLRGALAQVEVSGSEGDLDHEQVLADLERWLGPDLAPPRRDGAGERNRGAAGHGRVLGQGAEAASPGSAEAGAAFALALQDPAQAPEPAPEPRARPDHTVRVDIGQLDRLLDQVGELVLVRNQLLRLLGAGSDPALLAAAQQLELITGGLQQRVMRTRMQPLRGLFARLPRQVRDLARELGKEVRLVTEGDDTEADRSILEALGDPLLHLVRNCVDHGIEAPALRGARGKPARGVVRVRAWHEGGYVYLEVEDDGGGIDLARVGARALEAGAVTPERLQAMSPPEVARLALLPGLSTAERVTRVSGRGVGLDVVRGNVERIGGTIDLRSRPGEGASFRVRIPLTLAIVPALIVECRGERYAIPQVHLQELILLEGEAARRGVERLEGALVHRLRDRLLPLVSLGDLLGLAAPGAAPGPAIGPAPDDTAPEDTALIVVVQAGGAPFGLLVDAVGDTEEIVVKPLGDLLRRVPAYGGAAVLGDGQVVLILDVAGLARLSHVGGGAASPPAASAQAELAAEQLLLLAGRGGERLALPLAAVSRLEEYPAARVEWAGRHPVIQHRERIVRLLPVTSLLDGAPCEPGALAGEALQVVICEGAAETLGLVVAGVVDIVEEPLTVQGPSSRPGVRLTAVVQGRVTEVLDVEALARAGARA